jgi:hypothetical protein
MRKVVIGITVTLALAGMLAGNAEAAPLRGCCIVAGYWMCGMACLGSTSVSASSFEESSASCLGVLQAVW